jgi:hypothetical protein
LLLLSHRLLLFLEHLAKLLNGLPEHSKLLDVRIDLLLARRIGCEPLDVLLNMLTNTLHEEHDFLWVTATLKR